MLAAGACGRLPGASWAAGAGPLSCSMHPRPLAAGRPSPLPCSSVRRQRRQAGVAGGVWASAGGPQQRPPPPPPVGSSSLSSADTDGDEAARPGLFANILKPLRDFGIGRTSMTQGGVGLFVFSGIGAAGALAGSGLEMRCMQSAAALHTCSSAALMVGQHSLHQGLH